MRPLSSTAKLVLVFGCFVLLAALAQTQFSNARIDLTEDRLYTLSDGTKNVLKSLKQPVRLKLTYSERVAAGYPQIQAYAQQVDDLLEAFSQASYGKISVERITPEPYSDMEDVAVQSGLHGTQTATGDMLYFGLEATTDAGARKIIPFFSPNREPQLEYDLVSLISRLNTPEKPKAALYTSLPLPFGPGGPIAMVQGNSQPYALYLQMREQYQITHLEADFADIPADTQLLMILHPQPLSAAQLYAVDQYVMRGGRLMVFIDPMSEMALSMRNGSGMASGAAAPPLSSDMDLLLKAWGVILSPGQVAADGKFAQQVSIEEGRPVFYLPWIGVQSSTFAYDSLSVQGLRQINVATSGILELQPRDSLKSESLFTTSDVAGVFDATVFTENPDPALLIETFQPTGAQYTLAAKLSGIFPSAFDRAQVPGMAHLARSRIKTSVLVVADTDMLSDALWAQVSGTREAPTIQPIADNGSFFFNEADQMMGDESLLSLRSRRPSARPFTLVQEKQIEAERALRGQQAQLAEDLRVTQQRIADLEGKGGSAERFLSKVQKQEMDSFRRKVTTTRKSLRAIQSQLRQSVQAMTTRIMLLNTALVPGILLLIALVRAVRRHRKTRIKTA
jgi:ABC-type uncharacterized transport system involved in gliding motility auxiliary subunit